MKQHEDAPSAPWTEEEYIHVDGAKYCYTWIQNQGMKVHLPGGQSAFAHDLMFHGHEVVVPVKIRGMKRKQSTKEF